MMYAGYLKSIDKIIFIFRGTINVTNWLEDFTYKQVQYIRCSGCKVHEGFYLSYLSTVTPFLASYQKLRHDYPTKDIVMTGSSMGAALATIAAI